MLLLLLSSHNIYFLLRFPATSSGSLTSSSITGVFQFLFPFFLNLTNAEIFPQETVCRRRLYQTAICPRWNLFYLQRRRLLDGVLPSSSSGRVERTCVLVSPHQVSVHLPGGCFRSYWTPVRSWSTLLTHSDLKK